MPKKLYLTEDEKRERQQDAMKRYRERLTEKYGENYWKDYQKKKILCQKI